MAKIVIPGYRTISAVQMEKGKDYRIWLHKTPCEPENARHVRLISHPGCPIRDMDVDDRFVAAVLDSNGNETAEKIIIVRNSDHPYYPITHVQGEKAMVQSRLSVLKKID